MAQFASMWAVKSELQLKEGATTSVKLKSGKTKQIKIEKFLYSVEDSRSGDMSYFYLPAKEEK